MCDPEPHQDDLTSKGRADSETCAFDLPDERFRFVAIDVETSCSASASICQIGLACVRGDGTIVTRSSYVDPQMEFSRFNIELHGIGPETVLGAPVFPSIFAGLAPFLARHPLVQHSSFDRRAIMAACAHHALPLPDWDWSDSVVIARRAWPEFKGNGGHGLGHLKRALNLSFQHHDAGEDARAAAMVVLRAEERLGTSMVPLRAPKRSASRPDSPTHGNEIARPLPPARQSD